MLVHVQCQYRHATGQNMRLVGRPLVDQRAFARLDMTSTQPEPPPRALPIATNSSRQRSTLPKLAASASAIAGSIVAPSPPRQPKYSSCSSIELVAISSSRLRPLSWNPDTVAKGSAANCTRMALSCFTAPP
jgi:hypothetical protein